MWLLSPRHQHATPAPADGAAVRRRGATLQLCGDHRRDTGQYTMTLAASDESGSDNLQQHWLHCMAAVAGQRDKASFMQIYDYFAPRLNSYLHGLGASPALAEELVQESLLSLWRKAHQFNPDKAALSTWLFRIARNLFIDAMRRQPNWLLSELDMEEEIDPHSPSGDSHADGLKVQQAIQQLPMMQAQVVYKSYFEAKSHSEIAEELQIPLGSVKSSLRLAFQKLRVFLGQAEGNPPHGYPDTSSKGEPS
ncbi:sigma-70 family RNA polymerase sigma factor [Pokkaliibacter plantistimulans]|nr:sigma-70 family RNA polymerase sigma factor [Pokkaliibacter plantistimulans]